MRRFHHEQHYPLRNGGYGVQMVCKGMKFSEAVDLRKALRLAGFSVDVTYGRHKSVRGEHLKVTFFVFRLPDATKETAPRIAEEAIKDAQKSIFNSAKGGDNE